MYVRKKWIKNNFNKIHKYVNYVKLCVDLSCLNIFVGKISITTSSNFSKKNLQDAVLDIIFNDYNMYQFS